MTAMTSKYAHQSEATTTTPRTAAVMMPAESEKEAPPTPRAMMTMSPCRFGEVSRRDAPAPPAADQGTPVEDGEPDDPEHRLHAAIDETGHQDAHRPDRRRRSEPQERSEEVGIAPAGDRVEHEIEQQHDQVGDPEQHRVRTERARYGERDDEHRGHRAEHARAHRPLLRLERVGEPGVARPRPPDRREGEETAPESPPGEVVRHELGDLREGEHHDEIEEELQRGDPLLALGPSSVHP